MADPSKFWFFELPWYKKLLALVLLPFVLPVTLLVAIPLFLFFGLIYLACECATVLGELRFRNQMHRRGRLLSRSEVKKRIAAEGGTMIIESPSPGWGNTRAWWTPDSLMALAPFPTPTEKDYEGDLFDKERAVPWDQWCWDNYVSPDVGRAFLVKTSARKRAVEKWRREFPNLEFAKTWSVWAVRIEFQQRQPPKEPEEHAS